MGQRALTKAIQGLRADLARLEDSGPMLERLVESLKRHGVDEDVLADALAEAAETDTPGASTG